MKHKRLLKITLAVVLPLIALLLIGDLLFGYDLLSLFIQNEVFIAIGLLVAIIQLVLWVIELGKKSSEKPTLKPLEQLREIVESQWVKPFLAANIHHNALIALGKELQPGQVIPASSLVITRPNQENRAVLADETILQVFQTEASKALLILGEPGAGKTTTLFELAQALIEVQRLDAQRPVPVYFNLASWADKQLPLTEWMIDELQSKYRMPKDVSAAWFAEHNNILPLLDGLDEVRANARLACVEAINKFIAGTGLSGIAVCCRTAEYEELGSRLQLDAAISLLPLTEAQIFGYMDAGGKQLAALQQLLRQDDAMRELAETPLMLSIMSLAYENASDIVADSANVTSKRRALFDRYIDSMFEHRPTEKKLYSKEKTVHYLSWLADRLQNKGETIFLVENLQPDWAASPWSYRLLVGLFWGVFIGGLWDLMGNPLYISVSFGVITFFLIGYYTDNIGTMETLGWSWKKFRQNAVKEALSRGLSSSLFIALIVSFSFSPFIGLIIGLFIGLLFGFIDAGLENQIPNNKTVVNQGIVVSWQNTLHFGIPSGMFAGIVMWLGLLTAGFPVANWFSFILFLFFGILAIGFSQFGGEAVIQHYILRLVLFLEGYTPFNLVRFLDASSKLIFLKKVGGSYVFIHRMFLEHLAEKWQKK
ncbi:NACHT domain-containing protein [Thiotrichales bacterium HSG1]|nr:NACHT domain-containing protein [Thiotrichales bacterium HSG1]